MILNRYFKLNVRFCNSSERGGLLIRLFCLFLYDYVEVGVVLVIKDKVGIIIVRLGVYVEGFFKVNFIKSGVFCRD